MLILLAERMVTMVTSSQDKLVGQVSNPVFLGLLNLVTGTLQLCGMKALHSHATLLHRMPIYFHMAHILSSLEFEYLHIKW